MEKPVGNISSGEVFAEDQSETTPPQQKAEEAGMGKSSIKQKQYKKEEEKDDNDDGNEEDLAYDEEADSDQESINLENYPEYIHVDIVHIDTYLKCQICLGIMRKVLAIKACGHRFCGECIQKSLRLGKKECPLCRVPCASHRATIEDANFGSIIAHFLP